MPDPNLMRTMADGPGAGPGGPPMPGPGGPGGPPFGGPPMPGAGPGGPGPGAAPSGPGTAPGGPGIDTPQEQQATQLLVQAGQMLRQAATVDPSIRYIIDKLLLSTFQEITRHYGVEDEGKAALQQAQLQKRNSDIRARGPGPGPMGPQAGPVAGV